MCVWNITVARVLKSVDRHTVLVALVFLLGFSLRFYALDGKSLWLDEGISIVRANLSMSEILAELRGNVHPPFYFFTLHFWIDLFGTSETAVRSLSAAFGTLSIMMTYLVARTMFDRTTGLLSSFLMALSDYQIYFSQEGRAYSLFVLLSLLSMYFLVRLVRGAGAGIAAGYVVVTSLAIYTHNFALFIMIAQNCYLLGTLLQRRDRPGISFRRWAVLQMSVAALYLPWMSVVFHQVSHNREIMPGIPIPTLLSVSHTLTDYSGSSLLFVVFLILSCLALFRRKRATEIIENPIGQGGYRSAVKNTQPGGLYLLLTWLAVPVVLALSASWLLMPIYSSKYLIPVSAAFYILTARGLQTIGNSRARGVIVLSIGIVLMTGVVDYYTKVRKQEWRTVAQHVDGMAKSGDVVIFSPGHMAKYVFNYYSQRMDLQIVPLEERDEEGSMLERLALTADGHDRIVLITSSGSSPDKTIKALSVLGYELTDYRRYDGGKSLDPWNVGAIDLFLFTTHPQENASSAAHSARRFEIKIVRIYTFTSENEGWLPTDDGLSLQWSDSAGRDRAGSLKITGTAPAKYWGYARSPSFPLEPGRSYKIKGWLLVSAINDPRHPPLLKCGIEHNGQWMANAATGKYDLRGMGNWQELSATFTTPAEEGLSGYFSIEKGTAASAITATLFLDDLSLEKLQ